MVHEQITIQYNLTFGNITCQVRYRMGNIIIRHCQNRNLRNRSLSTFDNTCSFIQACKVGIQISRISFTGWNFSIGRREFTYRFTIGSHIRENDKNIHATLICQIFCRSQCSSWCQNSFNNRIIGQVDIHDNIIHDTCFFKRSSKQIRDVILDTHGTKYNTEIICIFTSQFCLSNDLNGKLIMRKTGSGKDRKLLTTDQSIQSING